MDRTVFLMIAMGLCAGMAVPAAFVAGRVGARQGLDDRWESELNAIRSEHSQAIATLQREIGQAPPSPEALDAYNNATAPVEPTKNASTPALSRGAFDAPVAPETYDALTAGMAYERVVALLGRDGTQTLSMVDETGSLTQHFVWGWITDEGARGKLDLSFWDGRLRTKSYSD